MRSPRTAPVQLVRDSGCEARVNYEPQRKPGAFWRTSEGLAKKYAQDIARAAQPLLRGAIEHRKMPPVVLDLGPKGYPVDARVTLIVEVPE
jgi:hypothetical protein